MDEVWLDTNILRRWNLRLDTGEADKFLRAAQTVDLQILLPEVVLLDLVEHYVRQASEELQREKRLKKSLARLEIPIGEGEWVTPPPDFARFYHELLLQRCAEKSISIVPIAEVPTRKLLDMSVKRILPFQGDKGEVGLRDTLILFCMLEYARQHNQSGLVLISNDGVFREERVRTLAADSGVELLVFESVNDFIDYLKSLLRDELKKIRGEEEERVRVFLLGHKQKIQEFIEENAEFGQQFLVGGSLRGTINTVIGVSFENITKVTVIGGEPVREGTALLLITFWVRLKIGLEIEKSPFLGFFEPKKYRVGMEPEIPVHVLGSLGPQVITVEREVVCEATAEELVKDKILGNLELKEVKVETVFPSVEALTEILMRGPSTPGTSEES